ncbi:MAG: transcriptional repressor [Oscillospiraceae bacterium]
MRKYSRQREVVLEVLRGVKIHPTAGWIYDEARQILPKISLGTIYRNLSELKNDGEIISFTTGDGVERFDGIATMHHHFNCTSCGSVIDLSFDETEALNKFAEEEIGCKVEKNYLLFYGQCKECLVRGRS